MRRKNVKKWLNIFVKSIYLINKAIAIVIFSVAIVHAKGKTRALDLVIYPPDSDRFLMIGNFIESELKDVFVKSKRFNVVNENKQNEQIFVLRKKLLQEGSCNKNNCFDTIKKLILTDVIVKINIQEIDTVYVIELLAIDKNDNYKLITAPKTMRYKKLGDLFNNIKKDTKKLAELLENEIWFVTHKPDWIIDLDISVSLGYVYNTGDLQSLLKNGWGSLVELHMFGLYQNVFLKFQTGFFAFSGKNYSEESAYFLTTDFGAGYMVHIPRTRFDVLPSAGIGGFMAILQSKTHPDLERRGILTDENTQKIAKAFYCTAGFKVSYQWNNIKAFVGIYDNIYFTKDVYNQVVTSVGVLYMF